MNYTILGRCSICSGNVVVPNVWYGVVPPVPECQSCHAVQQDDRPVIKMENNKTETSTGTDARSSKRFLQD